jgi:elongation factor P
MKISAVEVKPGMIIEHKNDYWNVLKAQHVKPGKGGAFNQVELKSITKGTKMNERFRSSETVEKAEIEEKIVISWTTKHLNKFQFQNH